ncbi:MAG: RNA polymerase sigma factor [Solirubrobacterales bacterium]
MQSDSRLLKLFRRGVDPAFDELVRRYRGALVGYASVIAGRDRAEDVVQDSLVKAHRSLSGDEAIEPKPWLYTVVRNTALNDIRDNRKHGHTQLGETESRVNQPHEVAEQKEELATVVAAVADLPAAQRRALVGHELGGYTHEQIAAELKLTTGATKQLIYRARLTLRNAVGAMIPFPIIAWLASDSVGIFAAGAATTGAAGAGALAASGGGATGGAGTGGLLATLAGTGAAKVAVVAVVAGGTLAGGLAVERHQQNSASDNGVQTASANEGISSNGSSGGSDGSTSLVSDDGDDGSGSVGEGSKKGSGDDEKGDDSSESGRPHSGSDDHGQSGNDDGPRPPGGDDDHSGSGHDGPRPHREGSGESGSGSGDDRPRPSDPDEGDDDGGGSGSSGGGGGSYSGGDDGEDWSGSGSSGSGGDDDYVAPRPPPAPKPESGSSGSSGADSGSGSDDD